MRTFYEGQIVKFKGNEEPCIVYRVLDAEEVWALDPNKQRECFCVRIEVMGLIPVDYLESITGVVGNVAAIDYAFRLNGQAN